MSTYTGITIGPLYETITMAKKTGEMWAASYIFSYIMREIIRLLKKSNVEFVIPYDKDERLFADKAKLSHEEKIKCTGAGFFHDRMIFKSDDLTIKEIEDSIVDKVLNELAIKITKELKNKDQSEIETYNDSEVYGYIKNYFQIYICQKPFGEKITPAKINKDINNILDMLELQKKFIPCEKQEKNNQGQGIHQTLLGNFFRVAKKSFLVTEAFSKQPKHFGSLQQIAASEIENENYLSMYNSVEDEKEIHGVLREDKDYKKYHDYVAIVQADGDSVGKTITALENLPGEFEKFSQTLLDFSLCANQLIKEYAGLPIFIGGDDLLFFAPIKNGEETVFSLIKKIDNCFKEKFINFKEPPTLSFGVSIGHYKYPLAESLNSARELLFEKAKNDKKNRIAYRFLIHSGQSYDGIIYKGSSNLYNTFNAFMIVQGSGKIFTSVMFEIAEQKAVIKEIGSDKEKLKNFFDNNFNETVHRGNENYFNRVIELIHLVFTDDTYKLKEDNKDGDDEQIKIIESILKLHKFIMGEK